LNLGHFSVEFGHDSYYLTMFGLDNLVWQCRFILV